MYYVTMVIDLFLKLSQEALHDTKFRHDMKN